MWRSPCAANCCPPSMRRLVSCRSSATRASNAWVTEAKEPPWTELSTCHVVEAGLSSGVYILAGNASQWALGWAHRRRGRRAKAACCNDILL